MDDDMQRAIAESHKLMAFFGRAQLVIESDEERKRFDGYASAIAVAQTAAAEARTLTASERAEFWKAFIALSNAASPATIESIRYYFNYYRNDRPARQRSGYTGVTWIVLSLTLLLSLVGFVGSRTLDQYAADNRHWYALVDIARLVSFGQKLEAAFDRDGKTLLIGTRGKELPPSEQLDQIASSQMITVNTRTQSGTIQPAHFTPLVAISPDRVLRLRAALPGLLDSPNDLTNEIVWHPACVGTEPCVRAAHVLLAEEFVFTLAGLQTERRILEAVLSPVTMAYGLLHPPALTRCSLRRRCRCSAESLPRTRRIPPAHRAPTSTRNWKILSSSIAYS